MEQYIVMWKKIGEEQRYVVCVTNDYTKAYEYAMPKSSYEYATQKLPYGYESFLYNNGVLEYRANNS